VSSIDDDIRARHEALNASRSFIVQAPAGSGKTELLIQRMLTLLARVEHPSEILAITFTKKAAGEMRERLFAALEMARAGTEPATSPARERWQLAREVLRRDAEKSWQLAQRPALLSIDTFDAFSLRVTKLAPLSMDGGTAGLANLADDASMQHREAARRALLEADDAQSLHAAKTLLSALDNRVDDVIALIADLLGKRAQWMDRLIDDSDDAIAAMREIIENSVESALESVAAHWPASITARLNALASHAAENAVDETRKKQLLNLAAFSADSHRLESLPLWVEAARFLLTGEGTWRKSFNKNDGFPAASDKGISAEEKQGRSDAKQAITSLLVDFSICENSESLRKSLLRTRTLPDSEAIAAHEPILRAALRILKLAAAELAVIERAAASTDFSGVSLAARHALVSFRDEVFGRFDAKIAHILVDEFQDTNPSQAALIESLVEDWRSDDGRTLFLVGDPMQSIYGFRDADIGIFLDAWRQGIAYVELNRITLHANYRSLDGIVRWVNETMSDVFSAPLQEESTPRVTFANAIATRERASGALSAAADPTIQNFLDAEEEAAEVVARISRIRTASPEASVAVIVRAKLHATAILQALQTANIAFEAREMARWTHRPLIRDLMSLTYVLAQPSDRLSWYAWLRSPMVGLSLATFAKLADWQATHRADMPAPLFDVQWLSQIETDEQKRIGVAIHALRVAAVSADLAPLAERVHAAFRFCGGDFIANTSHERAEVEDYLAFLDEQAAKGFLPPRHEFERALQDRFQSFASAHNAISSSAPVELLTIHKAKGLEWDYVILPQWNRRSPAEKRHLVVWDFVRKPSISLDDNTRSSNSSNSVTQLLVAAKETRRKIENSVFQFVQDRRVAARKEEAKRLLYVAVTRAREGLFISGSGDENKTPHADSLAALMSWPVASATVADANAETQSVPSKRRVMSRSLLRFEPPFEPSMPQVSDDTTNRRNANNSSDATDTSCSRRNEIALGVVGHRLIEGLARAMAQQTSFKPNASAIAQSLKQEGMNDDALHAATDALLRAVELMEKSAHFAFIHDPSHTEAADELAIAVATSGAANAATNGTTQMLRVDRTFVTHEGERWIVDYKFSKPSGTTDSEIAHWLDAQKREHAEQLNAYATVFSANELQRAVKCALYFPRVDQFVIL
jgi:ATP-dependent helicase/nuclease subunit A